MLVGILPESIRSIQPSVPRKSRPHGHSFSSGRSFAWLSLWNYRTHTGDLQAFVRRDFELWPPPVSLNRFARWLMTEETSARGRSFFLPVHSAVHAPLGQSVPRVAPLFDPPHRHQLGSVHDRTPHSDPRHLSWLHCFHRSQCGDARTHLAGQCRPTHTIQRGPTHAQRQSHE